MRISKRVTLASGIVLFIAVLAAGAYLRISGQKSSEATSSAAAGDLPAVSATDEFDTSIPVPVEGAEVVLDTLVMFVSAQGQAASRQQTTVRSQVSGQIRSVRVAENQSVGSGTVLIEVDPTEYEFALQEANARVAEAALRYRDLTIGNDRMTDERLRAANDSSARMRSGLAGAEVAVKRAQIDLTRTRVTAPFGGRVANLLVVPGQHVSAGEDLLTVQAMDPIRVEAQVGEGDISFLTPGRTANVTFTAFPGVVFQGRIASINPVIDRARGTARVSILVANADGRILPGMYARISLDARRFADRVLVPREALLERDRRNMLFVFNGEGELGRAEWRYVNLGLRNDTHVEIIEEGPEQGMVYAGDIVLVSGHNSLNHDIAVRLVPRAAGLEGSRVR